MAPFEIFNFLVLLQGGAVLLQNLREPLLVSLVDRSSEEAGEILKQFMLLALFGDRSPLRSGEDELKPENDQGPVLACGGPCR